MKHKQYDRQLSYHIKEGLAKPGRGKIERLISNELWADLVLIYSKYSLLGTLRVELLKGLQ